MAESPFDFNSVYGGKTVSAAGLGFGFSRKEREREREGTPRKSTTPGNHLVNKLYPPASPPR